MKSRFALAGGLLAALALSGSALADAAALKAVTSGCLIRHANVRDAAAVTLECTAAGGKLSDCKVIENTGPKGFAQAAVCVAAYLPIGDKTGAVRLPVRFPGGG